ncbi:MAG: CBS domain-containing protein [Anaerolineae bacterium]|nr:CBS domain-containing protein [Anaerolineae bacterium]
MLVRDFMTPNPVTISPNTSHHEAVKIMRERRFRRLPVVDEHGHLVGIVVEKDLLSAQPSPATTLSIWEIHNLLSKLKVADIMSHPVYTVRAYCPIEDAARIMVQHRIGCLPVMEGDKLIGIITETDIFRTLTQMLAGGEPGIRIAVRMPRMQGAVLRLAQAIYENHGRIVSMATLNEPDGQHKLVAVKVTDANPADLEKALHAHSDWEIEDFRESSDCHVPQLFGKPK